MLKGKATFLLLLLPFICACPHPALIEPSLEQVPEPTPEPVTIIQSGVKYMTMIHERTTFEFEVVPGATYWLDVSECIRGIEIRRVILSGFTNEGRFAVDPSPYQVRIVVCKYTEPDSCFWCHDVGGELGI